MKKYVYSEAKQVAVCGDFAKIGISVLSPVCPRKYFFCPLGDIFSKSSLVSSLYALTIKHFLVHGYYQVDPEEVWNVMEQDLQPLKDQILEYIKEL